MPKIVVDAMGTDKHPDPEVQAAVQAVRLYGDEILLVGDKEVLQPKVQAAGGGQIRIVHAPDVFKSSDHISTASLRNSQDSMAVGMRLVKSGEADAFVTMGNTGGAMANALFTIGRMKGVKRPALTAPFPVRNGRCIVLDIGANADCKPEYLAQFALMGSVYAETLLGIPNPKVGLLSNGEEEGKGNELVKETYPLLKMSPVNFAGNVEGKELFAGEVDVVVTDGFSGNILLKGSEAVARLLIDVLREEIMSTTRTKIGGLLVRPAFAAVRKMLDPSEYGAIPLLGIAGLVFVGHGRSEAPAVLTAIRVAREAVEVNLLSSLQSAIETGLTQRQA